MRHLTIVGVGTIGTAVARAVLDSALLAEDALTLVERQPDRQENLRERFPRATIVDRIPAALDEAVLLAVKPQDAPAVFAEFRGHLAEQALVFSCMAGVPLATLEQGLDHRRVVRVMTNTPLTVRRALSVWMAGEGFTASEKKDIRDFLSVFGMEAEVTDENLLDVATAVSGSGPAYFFTFFEALIEAALSLGLSRAQAEQWVRQTAIGAAALWEKNQGNLHEMIQHVQSKGGTTEAALGELPNAELKHMWSEALARAYTRAKELSKTT